MIRFIKNEACKNYALLGSADDSANLKSLDAKLIQISVNAFRSLVFVLTTINILAIDFSLYPHYFRKSEKQGISLMDTGVGFFILCHSMRYIRNSPSDSADRTIQTYVDWAWKMSSNKIKGVYFLKETWGNFGRHSLPHAVAHQSLCYSALFDWYHWNCSTMVIMSMSTVSTGTFFSQSQLLRWLLN